jgi:hypothetical protein
LLQQDAYGNPIHVLGAFQGRTEPAVVVTPIAQSPPVIGRLYDTESLMTRRKIKLIRQGRYAAEVPIEPIEDDTG